MNTLSGISRYEICSRIGKGTYGEVFIATDLLDNSQIALKKIAFKDSKEGVTPSILREISILACIEHPNIVQLKNFFEENESYWISFEYLRQDLKNYLDNLTYPLTEPHIKQLIYQILSGINHCHNNCIVHRDLKPQNILLSHGKIKICDFGLSKYVSYGDHPTTPNVQTLWYRAPELLLGGDYDEKIDIWSVGCIFGEMITGMPIFAGNSQIDQLWNIFKTLGTPDIRTLPGLEQLKGFHSFPKWQSINFKELFPVLSEEGVDFISKVLVIDPVKRINSNQALSHRYFREFTCVDRKYN